ncbi:hypothetical protein M408DRAFT_10657 [Serendipita vermifera MAFF 305830]|uniref:Uncharacterized protein n=1 Tax=Serendipita vermifera MAFF 305830 TaxID=933852 RepID=A0A0C2WFG3_SERVB|nr:hypothetical protein M408DRAFT_10657 [Serendipita vermifera MAFF 305830]
MAAILKKICCNLFETVLKGSSHMGLPIIVCLRHSRKRITLHLPRKMSLSEKEWEEKGEVNGLWSETSRRETQRDVEIDYSDEENDAVTDELGFIWYPTSDTKTNHQWKVLSLDRQEVSH